MDDDLTRRIELLETQMREHMHNGVMGAETSIKNIRDTIKTVTVAGELTKILAGKARKFNEQIFIDTTTATKKLYIYDTVGAVWRSVTIA